MESIEQTIYLALHHTKLNKIKINNIEVPIKISKNNQRYLNWNGVTYITQEKNISKYFDSLMKNGKSVTRLIKPKQKWSFLIDGKTLIK